MKRGLILPLCALAAWAVASPAMAQTVSLSLNLHYNDPADPTEGGTWALVAKTSSTDGIAGVSAYISNITAAAATMQYGNGLLNASADVNYQPYDNTPAAGNQTTINAGTLAAILNAGNPFAGTFGGAVNVVYGQDTATGPIVLDVGGGTGTPGNIVNDPFKNATWNNAAVVAQGTFGGTRPAFVAAGANSTDANVLPAGATTTPPANSSVDATTSTTVRGDALATFGLNTPTTAGLLRGDANRDFIVNGNDLNQVLLNFGQSGKTWGQGDMTDGLTSPPHVEGQVNGNDLNEVLLRFGQSSAVPPAAVGSVPEPASAAMALASLVGLGGLVRRRRS